MTKNKRFIVLQTRVVCEEIWVYGFLDDGSNERHCKWYQLEQDIFAEKEIA